MQPTKPPAPPPADHNIVRTSTTGAVLGQPGREHGAYGLVLDPIPEAATPSADERRVRGLGPEAGRPPEDYLLDERGVRVPSLPTETSDP